MASRALLASVVALAMSATGVTVALVASDRDSAISMPTPAVARAFMPATGDRDPCDPPASTLAAGTLGVGPDELRPGERYPSTGTCVFWSTSTPGTFVVVQLDGRDSGPPAWPCAREHRVEEARAEVNGTAATVTACTTP